MSNKVSVIIPNYNHAPFLAKRIDSVLYQTFQNLEIIILDDKSSDNSMSVIKEYSNNPKVRYVIQNEGNSGSPFKQWLKGIELATGDYIWIAESDDFAEPTFLEELMSIGKRYPDVDLIYANSLVVDENNNVERPYNSRWKPYDRNRWEKFQVLDKESEINNYMLMGTSIPNASAVIFKKEKFLEYCPADVINYKIAGDWYVWSNFILKGKVAYTPELLNYFRRHKNTQSSSGNVIKEKILLLEGLDVTNFILKEIAAKKAIRTKVINYHIKRFLINRGFKKEVLISSFIPKLGLKYFPYILKYYIRAAVRKASNRRIFAEL